MVTTDNYTIFTPLFSCTYPNSFCIIEGNVVLVWILLCVPLFFSFIHFLELNPSKLRVYLFNENLYQGPNSNFPGPTSGSTACVAVIRNDKLIVANAGDSRCVISRKGQVL